MRVAVLMACFNRKDCTIKCLDALFNVNFLSNQSIEVFLLDDGSTDGTSEAIKKKYINVNIIQGDGNLFWNRGMHLAWKVASKNKYDFYLWLNDDVILNKDSFQILWSNYKVLNQNCIISGVCASEDGFTTYGGYILKNKKNFRLQPQGKPIICDFFNGNIVLVPKEVFNKVGNLDPIFPHAQGDFDYGLRAKKMGINSYITSKSIALCDRHKEYPKWCNPNLSFRLRLSSFFGPLGGRPYHSFVFEKRHYSLHQALLHYITIHFRLLFPKYWVEKKKSQI